MAVKGNWPELQLTIVGGEGGGEGGRDGGGDEGGGGGGLGLGEGGGGLGEGEGMALGGGGGGGVLGTIGASGGGGGTLGKSAVVLSCVRWRRSLDPDRPGVTSSSACLRSLESEP